jgi:hypothetical protein
MPRRLHEQDDQGSGAPVMAPGSGRSIIVGFGYGVRDWRKRHYSIKS